METDRAPAPTGVSDRRPATGPGRLRRRRVLGLVGLVVLIAVASALSLAVGARGLSPAEVWSGLVTAPGADPRLTEVSLIVQTVRVPRTLLAIVAGIALGVAGALVQGHTRNPIADTGLLGINTGASFAVVLAIFLFGWQSPAQYIWVALLGAALAATVVFGVASIGRGAGNPLTLVLVGQGVAVFLFAMTTAVALADRASLNALRQWNAGTVAGSDLGVIGLTAAFVGVGLVLAAVNLPTINLLNLGDDVARALGVNLALGRTVGVVAITVLAGAATAACGPIAFLGLMTAHVARFWTGPDHRWLVPSAGLLGAVVMLVCDVVGRLVAPPGELQVGVVVALVGAPFFAVLVWLGRFRRT